MGAPWGRCFEAFYLRDPACPSHPGFSSVRRLRLGNDAEKGASGGDSANGSDDPGVAGCHYQDLQKTNLH